MAKRPFIQLLSAFAVPVLTSTTLLAAPPPMRVEATFKQSDGRVLIAGQASSGAYPRSIVVARMNQLGHWDLSFGPDGYIEYPAWQAMMDFRATALTVQPDGKIVVAAKLDDCLALVRLDSGGNADASFGFNGPGLVIDCDAQGLQVNALHAQADGGILGLGSFPNWGGPRTAAAVRHMSHGPRDLLFGNNFGGVRTYPILYSGESELRAIVPTASGFVAAGHGRETPSTRRKVLAAGFLEDGSTDYAFGSNGWSLYDINYQVDAEAVSIRIDPQSGYYMVAGANGHQFGGVPQNWLTVSAFNGMGFPDYYWGPPGPMGQVPMPLGWDGNATAVVAEPLAGNDLLIAGSVIEIATGRSHFAVWRWDRDYQVPISWGPFALPVAVEDDVMATAFATPDGQMIIAVGTRESASSDAVVRMRYFADNGEFDTVMTDDPDTTPNAFAFQSYGPRVSSGYRAASQRVRITGINTATPISVTGGQYVVDCDLGPWTSNPGYIYNGQNVCVRVTAATTPDTTRTVTLNIGSVEAGFSLTTGYVPDTLIGARPTNPGTPAANFTYRGDSESTGATSFQCRLDSAPFASCPLNGIAYSNLTAGSHTFEVRGANEWGQDQSPASYTWVVADLPQTTVDSAPAYYINVTNATVTFSSPDPAATFQCRLNGAAYATCTSPKTYTGLAVGGYTFNVRAVNAVGTDPTPAQAQWIIDTTAPDTSIASGLVPGAPPYGVRSFEIFLASNEISSHFQYSLNGGPFVDTQSPVYLNNLADGNYTFAARAIDPHGNIDATPVTVNFTVDTTAPGTAIDSGPSGTVKATTATFTFSASERQAGFECKLDGGAFAACTSPKTYTGLPKGIRTFQVRAVDAAGNVDATPASRSWRIN